MALESGAVLEPELPLDISVEPGEEAPELEPELSGMLDELSEAPLGLLVEELPEPDVP